MGRLALLVLAGVLASAGVAMAAVFGGPFGPPGGSTSRDCVYDPSTGDCSTRDDVYGDTTPPSVTLTAPADGSATNDSSPEFGGTAGTEPGDSATVGVSIGYGPDYGVFATRNGSTYSTSGPYTDAWDESSQPTLPDGNYVAQAFQNDASANTGYSAQTHFTIDTVKPSSSATSPAASDSGSIEVGYTADGTGSGLGKVELYAKGPADVAFAKVDTDSTPAATGHHFTYTASAGSGDYAFYTVATDKAENAEDAPSSADSTTTLDISAPSPTLTSPVDGTSTNDSSPGFAGKGGIAAGDEPNVFVKLWSGSSVGSGDPDYTVLVPVDPSTGAYSTSGPFVKVSDSSSHSTLPDGTYTAEVVQSDNGQHTGHSAAATFTVDAVAPTSSASAPAASSSTSIQVGYSADGTGSALGKVELYVKGPADSVFAKVATDSSPAATGHHFTYTAGEGDGDYAFYTLAHDQAGNAEVAPSVADDTTKLATAAPPNPVVVVFAPGDGAVFVEGARQHAAYACGDSGGPGLASCTGPVPNGGFIDTDKVGRHSFAVTAVGKGGQTTTRTVHYRVLSRGTLKRTGRVRAFRRNGKVWIDTGITARCPGLGPDCVGFAHPHSTNRAPRLKPGAVESAAGRPAVRIAGGKSVRLVFEVTSKRRVAALERGRTIRLWVHARLSRGTKRFADMRRLADVKLK